MYALSFVLFPEKARNLENFKESGNAEGSSDFSFYIKGQEHKYLKGQNNNTSNSVV